MYAVRLIGGGEDGKDGEVKATPCGRELVQNMFLWEHKDLFAKGPADGGALLARVKIEAFCERPPPPPRAFRQTLSTDRPYQYGDQPTRQSPLVDMLR